MSYRFFDLAAVVLTSWPLAVLIIVLLLKDKLPDFLRNRGITIRSKGIEIIISKLEEGMHLNSLQRRELQNLTPHDIWALDGFDKRVLTVGTMTPAQKVAAVALRDIGLVEITGDQAALTALGKKILETANNILYTN